MAPPVLHVVLYAILHALFFVYDWVIYLGRLARIGLQDELDQLRSLPDGPVPAHLAVAYGWATPLSAWGEKAQMAALKRLMHDVDLLVQWCALAGVPELSLYDAEGWLAGIMRTRLSRASRASEDLLTLADDEGYTSVRVTVFLGTGEAGQAWSVPLMQGERMNGRVVHAVHLNILSSYDDKQALVNVMDMMDGAVTPSRVDEALKIGGPLTCAPDVLMVCSDRRGPPALHGFPCWPLRLTTIGTLHAWPHMGRWTAMDFRDTLHLYAKTEQRHGA